MAEFQKVIKEWKRMCKDQSSCKTCPIYSTNCYERAIKNPELAEERIMQWAAEHPLVTNRDKFKEVFGFSFVDLFINGIPRNMQDWLDAEYKERDSNEAKQ